MFYQNKNVLVTGGTGLIGKELVNMLVEQGAKVFIASLDDSSLALKNTTFTQTDLREFSSCIKACEGMDIVFNLAGVKGSPQMTAKQPASFFVPTLQFSINMMEAARRVNAKYLFTSSIGVYAPAEVFFEDDVWKTFPSPNDRFAGWAKRMGELQAESYKIEYGWNEVSIVRPANVYGMFDNFDPANAMVIPSLIHRVISGENPLNIWGDGSAVRDFIHARDVARGMMLAVEKNITEPINLGSGTGVTIKEIAEILVKISREVLGKEITVNWDTTKPTGDAKRLMDMKRAHSYGFKRVVSLEEGIKETFIWYLNNKDTSEKKYNSFKEKK